MKTRLAGILLFLPVPLVLWLFTRMPFGVVPSLAAGILLMGTHRLYARPFALRRAPQRCLWCGGSVAGTAEPAFLVEEPGARTGWRACRAAHFGSVRAVLGWAHRRKHVLRIGILGAVAVFLASALLAEFHVLGPIVPQDASAFFRAVVALLVLPLGWLGPRAGPSVGPSVGPSPKNEPLRAPFPVHIQALVGTVIVIWLFRLVGILWLVQAAAYAVGRFRG